MTGPELLASIRKKNIENKEPSADGSDLAAQAPVRVSDNTAPTDAKSPSRPRPITTDQYESFTFSSIIDPDATTTGEEKKSSVGSVTLDNIVAGVEQAETGSLIREKDEEGNPLPPSLQRKGQYTRTHAPPTMEQADFQEQFSNVDMNKYKVPGKPGEFYNPKGSTAFGPYQITKGLLHNLERQGFVDKLNDKQKNHFRDLQRQAALFAEHGRTEKGKTGTYARYNYKTEVPGSAVAGRGDIDFLNKGTRDVHDQLGKLIIGEVWDQSSGDDDRAKVMDFIKRYRGVDHDTRYNDIIFDKVGLVPARFLETVTDLPNSY